MPKKFKSIISLILLVFIFYVSFTPFSNLISVLGRPNLHYYVNTDGLPNTVSCPFSSEPSGQWIQTSSPPYYDISYPPYTTEEMTIKITVLAPPGYRFVKWIFADGLISTDNPLVIKQTIENPSIAHLLYQTLHADTSPATLSPIVFNLTAVFASQTSGYILSTSVYPNNSGSISFTPFKSLYQKDDQVTLTASSNSGYRFVQWTGDVNSTENPVTITMNGDKVLIANFTNSYTINAVTGTGGKIYPSGRVSVVAGDSQTFTITPDTGYKIKDVIVDGKSVGAISSYTFTNVSSDHTITASFEEKTIIFNPEQQQVDPSLPIDLSKFSPSSLNYINKVIKQGDLSLKFFIGLDNNVYLAVWKDYSGKRDIYLWYNDSWVCIRTQTNIVPGMEPIMSAVSSKYATWDDYEIAVRNTEEGTEIQNNPSNNPTEDLTIRIEGPSTAKTGISVDYVAYVSGGTVPYHIVWNNNAVGTSARFIWDSPGDYVVKAVVSDANNMTASASLNVTVTSPVPLTAIVYGPSIVHVGEVAQYTVTPSGGTPPYTYNWDNSTFGSTATYIWSSPGNYAVSVIVKDSSGNSVTVGATVKVFLPLTVDIAGPTQGYVGDNYMYSGVVSGGSGSYTYTWSMDGLQTGQGKLSAIYMWTDPGNKTIMLRVSDGYQTVSKQISVNIYSGLTVDISGPLMTNIGFPASYTANVFGGMPPYTYTWSTDGLKSGQGTSTATYNWSSTGNKTVIVTVKDSMNKMMQKVLTVTVLSEINVVLSGPTSGYTDVIYTYTASVSGGSGNYEYAWSADGYQSQNGLQSASYKWLSAGSKTVSVKVTDATTGYSTTVYKNVNISEKSSLTVAISPAYLVGNTDTPYLFNASVANGVAPYTYSWNNGATGSTSPFAQYVWNAPGTYSVKVIVTDSIGQTGIGYATANISNPLTVFITGVTQGYVNVNYSYTLVVSGGVAPYTFTWSTDGLKSGQNTGTVTYNWSTAGNKTISVTVTDSSGASNTASLSITIYNTLTVTISPSSYNGYVLDNITFVATASGGTGSYTYTWSTNGLQSGQSTKSAVYIWNTIGNYSVQVTVNDGLSTKQATASVSLSNVPLHATISPDTLSALVDQSYNFVVTTYGGTGNYTYDWVTDGLKSVNKNQAIYSWSSSGYHPVHVRVSDGVNYVDVVAMVNVYTLISVSITPSPLYGKPNISYTFTVTASGGSGNYAYSWDNGTTYGSSNTYTKSWSSVGTYSVPVYVRDTTTGFTRYATADVYISNLTVSISPKTTTVNVNQSVTFTATPSNGTAPYQYSWDGGSTYGSSNTFSKSWSSPGTYSMTVWVKDSTGATASDTATVTVNNAVLSVSISGPTCGFTGKEYDYLAIVNGGTPPYTYSWSMDGLVTYSVNLAMYNWSTTGNKSITFTVTDGSGTTKQATLNVSIYHMQIHLSGTTSVLVNTNTTFFVYIEGGSGSYTYTWSTNGLQSGQGTAVATYRWSATGSYNVRVDVQDTCSLESSWAQTPAIVSNFAVYINPPLGFVCKNSPIIFSANVSGGYAPYQYSWDGGATYGPYTYSTTSSFSTSRSSTGTYLAIVLVKDYYGNIAATSAQFIVTDCNALTVSISPKTTTVNVNQSVTFTATPSNGTAPYQYSWDGGSTYGSSNTFSKSWSSPGTYSMTVWVKDSTGATASDTATVTVNSVALSVSISGSTCGFPNTSYSYTATISGGTSPYTYNWNNGAGGTSSNSSFSTSWSSAGSYNISLTVTDKNGVQGTATLTVAIYSPLAVSISGSTTVSVNTSYAYSANVSGGSGTYSYNWSADGLQSGQNTGTATYKWSSTGTKTITLTVTDSCNNTQKQATLNVTVNSVTLPVSISGSTCGFPNTSYSYTATISGGTSPYTYNWNNGAGGTSSNSSFSTSWSSAGSYNISLTVTDKNGVQGTATLTVAIYSPLAVSISGSTTVSVNTSYAYSANVSGGSGTYSYNWSADGLQSGQNTGTATYKWSSTGTKTITLTVTDSCNNTQKQATLNVTVNSVALSVSISGGPTLGVGNEGYTESDYSYTATVTGGSGSYTYTWSTDGLKSGQGTSTATYKWSTAGTKTVTISVTDSSGASGSNNKTAVIYQKLAISITGNTNIYTEQKVTYASAASGGKGTLSYYWDGDISVHSTNATYNTYWIVNSTTTKKLWCKVTDQLNTSVQSNILTITVNYCPPLKITIKPPSGVTTFYVNTSYTFTATIEGGVTPYYDYNWIDGSGGALQSGQGTTTAVFKWTAAMSHSISFSCADSRAVTATSSSYTVTTVQPGALTYNFSFSPNSGRVNQNVSVNVSVSGGVSPYTYSNWSTDGRVSYNGNTATYRWTSSGNKTVSVVVKDSTGAQVTASSSYNVYDNPTISFTNYTTMGNVGTEYTFTVSAYNLVNPSYVTFSADSNATLTTASTVYSGATGSTMTATVKVKWTNSTTSGEVTATVTDSTNTTATAKKSGISMLYSPFSVSLAVSSTSVAVNSNVTASATASGGKSPYSYTWSTDGLQSGQNTSNTTYKWSTAGTKTITVTAKDSQSPQSTDTQSKNVVVGGGGALSVTVTGPTSGSKGNSYTFQATVTGGTSPYQYSWTLNGVSYGTSDKVTYSFGNTGSFVVKCTVKDSAGATNSDSLTIVIT